MSKVGIRSSRLKVKHEMRVFPTTFGWPYANDETNSWVTKLATGGGTVSGSSGIIADNLISAMKQRSYYSKVLYMCPLLGNNLLGAVTPLIDVISSEGIRPTQIGASSFVDADHTAETIGLNGNGTKQYESKVRVDLLGAGIGGIGWWESNINWSGPGNVEPIGFSTSSPDNRFSLDLRSDRKAFRWGLISDTNSFVQINTAAANGHYYGQKSSTTDRRLFYQGAKIGTNTGSNSTSAPASYFSLMGTSYATTRFPWQGRSSCWYFTNGTLSDAEATDLHSDLGTWLITPTGR